MGSWWDKVDDAWRRYGKYTPIGVMQNFQEAAWGKLGSGKGGVASGIWGKSTSGEGGNEPIVGVGTPEWLWKAYREDPEMQALMDRANKIHDQDYQGLFQGAARQGADTQSRSLSNALAARGGGQLGSALGIGSQARVGAETQGLMAGLGAEQQSQDMMLDALTQRYNVLSQIMGGKLGFSTAQLQYKASQEASQNQLWGQVAGAASNVFKYLK